MSGGAFDYAYLDAEGLANDVGEMREHAERNDYPRETVVRLERLENTLRGQSDFLRTLEWVASGDYGPDQLPGADCGADDGAGGAP